MADIGRGPDFVGKPANATFGGSGGMGDDITNISGPKRAGKGVTDCFAQAPHLGLLFAIGDFGTKSRVEGEKCNEYRYKTTSTALLCGSRL